LKNSYVDVLAKNTASAQGDANNQPPMLSPVGTPNLSSMPNNIPNMFVPTVPVGVDHSGPTSFLTTGPIGSHDEV